MTMEAAISDSIEFELWDDKKIQKKLKEYAVKDYSLDQVLGQVLSPKLTLSAIAEYLKQMPAINERISKVIEKTKNAYRELQNKTE